MNMKKWKNISIIASILLGTLLHFTYQWSGENRFVALFSAINESTWEHLKLSFFPMLLMGIIGYFLFGKNTKNYIKASAIGILSAMAFITVVFYTYTGMIGQSYGIVNILLFILSIILSETLAYKITQTDTKSTNQTVYTMIVAVLVICFAVFTFYPPHIDYFKDPVTGEYGIPN